MYQGGQGQPLPVNEGGYPGGEDQPIPIVDGEYKQIHSFMVDGGDRFGVSSLCFDTQELLWMGNQGVCMLKVNLQKNYCIITILGDKIHFLTIY